MQEDVLERAASNEDALRLEAALVELVGSGIAVAASNPGATNSR